MTIPAYTVRVAKLEGAPYHTTTIKVDGKVIRSVLGPLSTQEVEGYVRDYMGPAPVSRVDSVQFHNDDKARSSRGGKATKKKYEWRSPREDE